MRHPRLPAAAGRFARALAILGAAALAAVVLPGSTRTASSARPPTAGRGHPAEFFDARVFARASARASAGGIRPMPGVRAVIVPHHWFAGFLIVGGLRDLAASGRWHRVILIGPNHIGAGSADVITSDLAWRTPFGTVEPDLGAVRGLIRAGVADSEPDVLTYEHSIAGIVPAIASALPGVRIVPLALRSRMAGVDRLARVLESLMDARTVIVASVDFSHYLSVEEARARDRETLAALERLDAPAVLAYGNAHLDSPPAIGAVMLVMREVGASSFVLLANTNSYEQGGSPLAPNVTSYVQGYYH